MDKKMLFAVAAALLMAATLVPLNASEDSDALTGNRNMTLDSDRAMIYVNSTTDHSFTFTASFTDVIFVSLDQIKWRLNDLNDGDYLVSFVDDADNPVYEASGTMSVTVYAMDVGSIEIEVWVNGDEMNHRASAVIVVFDSPGTTADTFHFWFQVNSVYNNYASNSSYFTVGNNLTTWNNGFWVTVTATQVAAAHPTWTFNATNALKYAVEQNAANGWSISFLNYGWIDTFMGLGTYYDQPHDAYIYWEQFHGTSGSTTWVENTTSLDFITTQDHSYIAIIFMAYSSTGPAFPNVLP